MSLSETAVLAVELKLAGATAYKTGISEAEAATAGLNRTVASSKNVLGGTTSNLALFRQAVGGTSSALGGMATHLKGVLTGPLGMIGLGAGLFTLAGAFKESVGMAQELGLATEKLTALTGESAAVVSTQVAVFQKYGISIDQASTLIGFAEKTLGKLSETSTPAVKGSISVAKAQDNVRIASEKLKVAHEKLIETEHRKTVSASQLTAAKNRVTDATVKLHQAQTALAGASDAPVAGLSKLQAFQKLYGITLTTSTGAAVDFETELRNVSDFYVSNAAASTKAYVAAQLFGSGYQVIIPILRLGKQGIIDAEKTATDLGLTLKDQSLTDLRDYQKNIRAVGEAIGGLQLQIGLVLIPEVGKLANSLTGFLEQGGTAKIVTGFKAMLQSAKELGAVVTGTVIPTIQGLAGTAKGFWDSIPAPLRDLIFKGVVADRTIHFLFGVSPIHLATDLLGDIAGPIIRTLIANRLVPQPVVVVNPGFGLGGLPGIIPDVAGGGAAVVGGLTATAAAALVVAPLAIAAVGLALGKANDPTGEKTLAARAQTATARGIPDWNNKALQELNAIHAATAAAASGTANDPIHTSSTDRQPGKALDDMTSALKTYLRMLNASQKLTPAQAEAIRAADRLARHAPGIGPFKKSDITPRLSFLAASHPGKQDLAVAGALVLGFETGEGGAAFRSTKDLKRTIEALRTDQKTLGPKDAATIGGYLERLKVVLADRLQKAKEEIARAQKAAGIQVAAAVKNKDSNITIPITSTVVIDGRTYVANLTRYTSVVGGKVQNATGVSGV